MPDEPRYHSRFGGLWIDRDDWRAQIAARSLDAAQAAQVTAFAEDGFVILPQAADLAAVDRFQARIEQSFRHGNRDVVYQEHGGHVSRPLDHPVDRLGTRVLDSYVAFPEALDLFASPALMAFLRLVFDADPLLFQSLSFDMGSQQGLHQDTAYVVVEKPLELAACWIALEDVRPGSGELMYVPGSHRLPDWPFNPDRKHWNCDIDGFDPHDRWSRALEDEAARSPRGLHTFLARKGDILVWHADLAHGGSPVRDHGLTRQSLVGHFHPQTTRSHYAALDPALATIRRHGALAYSSQHYDMRSPTPRPLCATHADAAAG